MRLLLTSNGLVTAEIIAAFKKLAGKSLEQVNVAVINEAYAVEHDDHRWVIDDLVALKNCVGGRFEMVNLLANSGAVIEERLGQADVIFVIGGNTDYLKTVFDKSGVSKLLPKLLANKVYVGISAGSMVMGKRISGKAYLTMYGDQGKYDVTDYLGLVDFSVMPHISSKDFPGREEKLTL